MKCEVLGRYKYFYSIYKKMVSQNLEFEEVYDIIAFRIILDTIPQCYEVLGLIHSLWKPVAKKFKDYIGVPKAQYVPIITHNSYRTFWWTYRDTDTDP